VEATTVTVLGQKKRRGRFLYFSEAPLIFYKNIKIPFV
jgi:hypothetical protein